MTHGVGGYPMEMGAVLRIAGLVAVAGAVLLIDGSTATWVAALVFTLVVGALVARWWALLAPAGIAAVAFYVERDETEVGVGTITLVFGIVLAVGVALGKLVRWPRTRRDHRKATPA